MLRIGAHMSVAGGVSKAVDRAEAHGCEALQIFTKNGSRWHGKPLEHAEALGLLGVVVHPGTCTAGSEEEGLRLIAAGIGAALAARRRGATMVLLEHTAGQGRTLGDRFEHL